MRLVKLAVISEAGHDGKYVDPERWFNPDAIEQVLPHFCHNPEHIMLLPSGFCFKGSMDDLCEALELEYFRSHIRQGP